MRGYKRAVAFPEYLLADPNPRFLPIYYASGTYGMDAEFQCLCDNAAGRRHQGPGWRTRCGFYAIKTPPEPWLGRAWGGTCTLEVELSGTVIEHDRGYRASHQRITKVIFDRGVMGADAVDTVVLLTELQHHLGVPVEVAGGWWVPPQSF